jgi:hypothetical protein
MRLSFTNLLKVALLLCAISVTVSAGKVYAASPPETAPPQTRLLLSDTETLNKIKTMLTQAEHAQFKAYLIGQADAIAQSPPLSVTQNKSVSVSGNSRDYFSVGPYWWPNPNTKNGLPWVNRDGQVNRSVRGANTDSKLFDSLASRLNTLALAYYMADNKSAERKRYAKAAEQQLNVWFLDATLGMSPHLNYAQAVPGKANGRGIGIIEVRKMPGILDAIAIMKNDLSAETQEGLDIWLSVFLGWLIESKNGQDEAAMHNNHGSFYDVIVVSLALHLDMDDLAKAILKGSDARAIKQIDSSGAQPHELKRTKPFHYSIFNLYAFASLSKMARLTDTPFSEQGINRLTKAHDYLFENLETSSIWPGPQEKTLPVERLIDVSMLLQQSYTDITIAAAQIASFQGAQTRYAACEFWMNGDDTLLAQLTIEQRSDFMLTRCHYLH